VRRAGGTILPGAGLPLDRGRRPSGGRAGRAILPGADRPPDRERPAIARRAGCANSTGASLPTDRRRSATVRRAKVAGLKRYAGALPSGDRIWGSTSGKADDGAGRSSSSGAARS
jgi:hypothetical protein